MEKFSIGKTRLAAIAAAMLCAASAHSMEWSRWTMDAGYGATATFAPSLDSRTATFSRGSLDGYSSLYTAIGYPGEVVVECAGDTPAAAALGEAELGIRVEVFRVDKGKAGEPPAPSSKNYSQNPHLPFGTPAGSMGTPLFTTVKRYPMGTRFPLRARFHIPTQRHYYAQETIRRICWTLFKIEPNGKEAALARGILPDAFQLDDSYRIKSGTTSRPTSPCHVADRLVPPGLEAHDTMAFREGGTVIDTGFVSAGGYQMKDEEDAPQLIPDPLLAESTSRYIVATFAFLIATFLLAGALLLRYFLLRKGEARMPVWWAFPAFAAAAGAFAILAVPLVLDRTSRVDITGWRFSVHGVERELWIAKAAAEGFDPLPARWETIPGGWFAPEDFGRATCIEYAADGTVGMIGGDGLTAARQTATAMHFEDCSGPRFSLTPDTESAADVLMGALDGDAGGGLANSQLARMLRQWTFPGDKAPKRTLTAHGDYSCVWLFVRNRWFEIGPMKNGESRDISESRPLFELEYSPARKNLLSVAPFVMDTKYIVDTADQWLAAVTGEQRMDDYGRPIPAPAGPPELDANFIRLLDDAIVVGRRSGETPPNSPRVRWSASRPRPQRRTGRIVDVEVIP